MRGSWYSRELLVVLSSKAPKKPRGLVRYNTPVTEVITRLMCPLKLWWLPPCSALLETLGDSVVDSDWRSSLPAMFLKDDLSKGFGVS